MYRFSWSKSEDCLHVEGVVYILSMFHLLLHDWAELNSPKLAHIVTFE